ncbi:MAG TPA: CotH kinase family protein, partial [Pirellulaceae bacterium]|nr:CotH kinase family protein [Pirellulaceae bacterium]
MDEIRVKLDAINQQVEAALIKLLTDKQAQRLQQLRLQREGAQAFSRPEIAKQLTLSDEQQTKLDELQQQAFSGFGPPRINPEDQAKALALLTAEQKATWDKLVGAEFKFPEMRGGAFGRGPGGPGFGGETRQLMKEFDKDNNGWLNQDERRAARTKAASGAQQRGPGGGGPGGRGPGGPGGGPGGPGGGPPGFGGAREPGKPGPRVAPSDVTPNTSAGLYDVGTLRTIFLDFENEDWETELETFHNTDIEVPATVLVDGQKYPLVGVHFRGMSSYGMVPRGSKRSFNLSFDMVDEKQRLYGYKTLNLLNANGDPSYLSSVLYSQIARNYIAAPKANFVKVVVNGESWGVYVNVQQFDKIFVSENYKSAKGTRWKVPGSPGGNAGLDYIGDNIADYKRRYEMKSNDNDDAWQALIKLCRTLKETPPDQLEAALKPMLDIDGVLWFLALDNGLINSDGYWVRASDYSIFLDDKGIFHVIPHDMNEAFHAMGGGFGGRGPGMAARPGGPGGQGGPGGRGPGGPGGGPGAAGGFALDPLVG